MKKIGIIPLRKGSKGIIGKNKKKILGRPLFAWVLTEAVFSDLDEVYIFTDDEEIINYVEMEYKLISKIHVIRRSDESASDTASTEMAMLELSEKIKYNYDIICLLQATSPLITKIDINECLKKVVIENFDSALSVVKTKRFIWSKNGESINYDYNARPRRQDFDGLLIENGAVYVTKKEQFIISKIRIGGKIAICEMKEDTLIEIDEIEDWVIVEKLLENRLNKFKKGNCAIKLLALDVDGVFTNGSVVVNKDGEFSKEFSMRDGMGIEIARENNLDVIVITSEVSEIVKKRMEKIGIEEIYMGVKDKYSAIDRILDKKRLSRNEVAYIGDDINDMANIFSVKFGIVPKDGVEILKLGADLILNNNGGMMAIREGINFILKYNKNL